MILEGFQFLAGMFGRFCTMNRSTVESNIRGGIRHVLFDQDFAGLCAGDTALISNV